MGGFCVLRGPAPALMDRCLSSTLAILGRLKDRGGAQRAGGGAASNPTRAIRPRATAVR
jgi:hypothetical protein